MGDCGQVKWYIHHDSVTTSDNVAAAKVAHPKYSLLGERLRHVTPSALQCSMFCGGRQCKYCNPAAKFKKEDMVIDGLYSAWVTDKILATSRPSTEAIKKFHIINQFHSYGITSIVNLQYAGEHGGCGFGLESSGFSYVPELFMENDIFFYNFEWNDYGVRSLQSILDMVQVMDFALLNGKAAVHCHAGLGRTGVLIACYIIFSERCTASEAIYKVRKSRPRSIQTREQINCVKDFASYIKPMWIIFAENDSRLTLQHFLNRQRRILHGEEAHTLRYIPKIVFSILQRLLQFANVHYDLTCCVKATYQSFIKKCLLNTAPKLHTDTSHTDTSQNETNLSKPFMDDDNLLCLQKQITVDLPNPELLSLEVQIKASSMPNVAFPSSEENTSISNRIILDPIKPKQIMKGLKEKFSNFDENGDDVSFISSFNSWGGQSLSLSCSLDASLLFREGSIASDTTSLLSRSLNTGLYPNEEVVKYLAFRTSDVHVHNQIERFKHKLNTEHHAWDELCLETSIPVLCGLLWAWLKHLQGPIVISEIIDVIKLHINDPQNAGDELEKGIWKLIEAFLTCLSKLGGRNQDVIRTLRRFAVALTGDETIPRIKFYEPAVDNEINGSETSGYIFFKFLLSFLYKLKTQE